MASLGGIIKILFVLAWALALSTTLVSGAVDARPAHVNDAAIHRYAQSHRARLLKKKKGDDDDDDDDDDDVDNHHNNNCDDNYDDDDDNEDVEHEDDKPKVEISSTPRQRRPSRAELPARFRHLDQQRRV